MDGDIEPVVVDLGTWMCKAGYAGDKTAQAYERTLVAKAQPDQLCFGTAALQSGEEHELSCPMSRGAVTDWEHMESDASVSREACGIEEVKKFQAVLTNYQLYVISKTIPMGPDSDNKIFLYHHDQHYDIITSMPAFLGRSYFCTECQKGYDHKEKHKCNNVCHSCYKIHESSKDDWIHCAYCNRFFKGQECYTLHKNQTAKGNLTCKTYHRCVHCSKLLTDPCVKENINAVENTVAHVKTVEKEHQCYMKPEEKIEESDEQEEDNKQTYIFFDFECTQEDIVECESGFKIGENGKICSTFDDANNTTAMQRINVGGHDVTETLARTVDARCGTSYSSSLRRLLQMEYLKERVCIYGESTQHTLPDGTAVEVDEEIRNICAMSHYHCQGKSPFVNIYE
ncbi:ACTB-like protein [Mya arenaria]|uniref:ACTB-like protein n=1 Tax=Mya arenaria TaxID=6604 RepID=A0ABY7EX87_MYAAR|nr:ACTB-like protein [Mya arenaria]